MVDYAKKTVAELHEILKSRSLPYAGKKAELIARLTEADKEAEQNEEVKAPPAEATTAPPAQVAEPAPETALETPAAATQPESAPAPAPAQPQTEAPADSPSANTDIALANSASYALNLPTSELDSELAKRKARAERFGTAAAATNGEEANGDAIGDDADGEAQRALERAKRFGTGEAAVGKLNDALPSEPERGSRKRIRTEEASAMDDPGLRRGFSQRGRGGGRGGGRFRGRGGRDNSRRRTGDKPSGIHKPAAAFSSEADRQAAEARKKKFGG